MKFIERLILIVMLMVILVGCSTAVRSQPAQTPIQGTPANNVTAYAPPVSDATVGYPAVATVTDLNYPDKIKIPSPQSGSGVVTGVLLVQSTQKPYLAVLFLGNLVYSTNSPQAAPIVSYSQDTDIHAQEDKTGRFVFDLVKPGKYALVSWSPGSEYLLTNLDSGNFIEVDVVAGQVTDLGNVYVK